MTFNPHTIVVHHAAFIWLPAASLSQRISDIRGWHLARGFNDIGYHAVSDGLTWAVARSWCVQGAHVSGHNTNTLAFCFADDLTKRDIRPDELEPFWGFIRHAIMHFPISRILGHSDLAPTLCPGTNTMSLLKRHAPLDLQPYF